MLRGSIRWAHGFGPCGGGIGLAWPPDRQTLLCCNAFYTYYKHLGRVVGEVGPDEKVVPPLQTIEADLRSTARDKRSQRLAALRRRISLHHHICAGTAHTPLALMHTRHAINPARVLARFGCLGTCRPERVSTVAETIRSFPCASRCEASRIIVRLSISAAAQFHAALYRTPSNIVSVSSWVGVAWRAG